MRQRRSNSVPIRYPQFQSGKPSLSIRFSDFGSSVRDLKFDSSRNQWRLQMSELFNRKCSIPGKIPSGSFNAMFGFQSGCWASDAVNTKYLGLDGYFISLFNAHIDRYPLRLSDAVRSAVPSAWDPPAIARYQFPPKSFNFLEFFNTFLSQLFFYFLIKLNYSFPIRPFQINFSTVCVMSLFFLT